MTIEMHLSGIHEAIFLRERDADVFMSDYQAWLDNPEAQKIFEFYHNGSIHCFNLAAVVYLKIKMPTDTLTRELAESGAVLGTGGSSARH